LELTKPEELEGRYYLRIHVKDQEGVLAALTERLTKHHISFATVNQKELSDGTARIMLTTHQSLESNIRAAKEALAGLDIVLSTPVSFRIFDPGA
jgi:homoserine dehydrogenase